MRSVFILVGLVMLGCGGGSSKGAKDTGGNDLSDGQSPLDSRGDNYTDVLQADTADAKADSVPDGNTSVDSGNDSSSDSSEDVEVVTPLFPFEVERIPEGQALSSEEIGQFTASISGFFKSTGYFEWLLHNSHGLHKSYNPDMPDYSLFWQDTRAYREGAKVRFSHFGGADNLALRTAKLLENAAALYLMSDDSRFEELIIGYCKGFAALAMGMVWSTEDPVAPYIQARAIFTHDHSFVQDGGRETIIEYGPVKIEKYDWNAHTVPNDLNPYYGQIWVRNMRSKDDVPHMFRMIPVLRALEKEAASKDVRDAASLALEYMVGFADDIVDMGYQIRTKEDGEVYVPVKEDGTINDLASFVLFEPIVPDAECNAKLATALVAGGDNLGVLCGDVDNNLYEQIAVSQHYFNLAIIRYFQLAVLMNAMYLERYDLAEPAMNGVIKRADRHFHDNEARALYPEWDADLAAWLLAAATAGMPLTDAEARLVMEQYMASAQHYAKWGYWDLWAEGIPEGEVPMVPGEWSDPDPENPDAPLTKYVRIQEMVYVFEYCQSGFRHPDSSRVLNCEVLAEPGLWGEQYGSL